MGPLQSITFVSLELPPWIYFLRTGCLGECHESPALRDLQQVTFLALQLAKNSRLANDILCTCTGILFHILDDVI